MTVLAILGVLAVVFAIYMYVMYINKISINKYKYEFFSKSNLFFITIAYALIAFGVNLYYEAINNQGDILNGKLLIAIGIIIILFTLYIHIKNTSFLFGVYYGLIQLIIYIPAGLISFLIAFFIFAWAMETRPVYRW